MLSLNVSTYKFCCRIVDEYIPMCKPTNNTGTVSITDTYNNDNDGVVRVVCPYTIILNMHVYNPITIHINQDTV